MNIAETKRQNNISEYIIHMYQTEDLIRAYKFKIEDIEEYVVKHIPGEDTDRKELVEWYSMIMEQMKEEGIELSGHLQSVQKIVDELSEMHEELQNIDSAFEEVHKASKVHIEKNLKLSKGAITSEVQICLNGVYGLLLLRMKGKNVSEELMESINAFGDILSYLSYKYKQKHFLSDN